MINGVSSNSYSYQTYNVSAFDYTSAAAKANQQAQELLESIKGGNNVSSVKTLQKDSANFLDNYASNMKKLDQSAEKLRNGNLDKMLYDSNGEITDTTVKKAVDAVKNMVTQYNDTIKTLNNNADRGPGIKKLLARMVGVDPAPETNMKMVGLSVNKDGTLAVDEEKLASAFKTEDPNQRKLLTDIIGGHNGIADKIHMNAQYGSNMSSWQLIGNDVANIKAVQEEENPFRAMYNAIKSNPYALNNMPYTGLMLNMLA